MDQEIKKVIENFESDLEIILENSVIDIIIHGSTVGGGFIKGKGDVDFLVFTNSKISEAQKDKIFDYHRAIRVEKTLASQLEGCYYSIDQESKRVTGGVYIGSSEGGWKVINEIVNSKMNMAHIMSSYYSTRKSGVLNDIFDFTWEEIENELKEQSKYNLVLLNKYDDYSFKVYAIYAAARSLFTIEEKGFISKGASLDWILKKEKYMKYIELLNECSKLRNPLFDDEVNKINKEKFKKTSEFLIQVDNDIQAHIN